MKRFFKLLTVVLLAGLGLAPVAQAEDKPFADETVKLGLVAGPSQDVWEVVIKNAKKEGINIEEVVFTDYNQPNAALQNGEIDLNAFQHVAFLEDWNDANKGDLEVAGYTFVSPMGAYSEKIDPLDDLEDGANIAIPNDPTNGGRAILALEIAGLIKVDEDAGALATPSDVIDNPKNIKFVEIDAAQLPQSLPDVDAAFINTNFLIDADMTLEEAIFIDADEPEKLNEAYRNVIAVKEENKDSELLLHIVELYQTDEVAQKLFETTKGGDRPVWEGAPVITE